METNSPIIADSSALISLAIRSDSNHAAAVAFMEQLEGSGQFVVIPCEVFAETVNLLGKKFSHAQAIEAVDILLDGGSVFVVEDSGDDIRRNALDLFSDAPAGVSFTDCVVMKVADSVATKDIFGFDKQFEDAGYNRLVPDVRNKAA